MNNRTLILDDHLMSLVVDFDPHAFYSPQMLPRLDRFVLIPGGAAPAPTPSPEPSVDPVLLREDGSILLREDGSAFLREDDAAPAVLLREDDAELLREDDLQFLREDA